MYLNSILILHHFKPLMALMLKKYTVDQSAWQTGKRGTAKTFYDTWGLCLAHPAKGRWEPQKIPSSLAGFPQAQRTGGRSLTHVSGKQDSTGGHECRNVSLAGRDGMEVCSWHHKWKPLLGSGLSERGNSPLVLAPFIIEQAQCQRSMLLSPVEIWGQGSFSNLCDHTNCL